MYRMNTKELSRDQSTKPHRIQPDRRWFGNTRVIAQNKMQAFRETLSKGVEDPFSVVLRSSKLPMSLLKETEGKTSRMNLLQVEPFEEVFGKKRRQKRVKLGSYDLEGLMQSVSQKAQGYNGDADKNSRVDGSGHDKLNTQSMRHDGEEIFNKGTSKRIWAELYKVVDASDVLLFVLDARDPMGTRCQMLEKEIRKNRPGKHIVLLLNKVDLVPTWSARRWVQILTKEYPTLAFHASITNPFGKNALLNLLRQFGVLIKERKHLTIGMVGYPNVGKSSVINTMRHKKVCKAAPIAGETKVWQYISLTKKLYMLDCPGIVPPTANDFEADCAKVLKGVVRPERIKEPSGYIDEVLSRVKRPYLLQRYKLPIDTSWDDGEQFLSVLAQKMGKLFKGGEPDIEITARMVLNDWQRGRIPFFVAPPEANEAAASAATAAASGKSSSSSAPAAPVEDGDTADAAKDEKANPSEAIGPVRQSLSELACAVAFDEEDRRGEPLPAEPETTQERRDRKEAEAESRKPEFLKSGKRRKRKAAQEAAQDGQQAEASKTEEAQASEPKAKKRRKISRNKKGEGGGENKERKGMSVQRNSMDWKAVVAEFDM